MARLTLPTTAEVQSRYTVSIDSFFGCDYTSSKLKAAQYRSIASENYIRRKNVLQKRRGYKQVASYGENIVIHNLWSFKDEKGTTHYIANMSGSLYEINIETFERTLIENGTGAVLDRKVSAFPTNNRLYILGGIKYLVLYLDSETNNLKLEYVVGSDFAYIPTTTIGITPTNSTVSGYRQDLDSANILTYWRKNRFISGLHTDKDSKETIINTIQEFQLDSSISFKNQNDLEKMTLDITFFDNDTTQFEISETSSSREAHFNVVFCKGLNLKGIDSDHTEDELISNSSINGLYILVNYEEGDFNSSYIESVKNAVLNCDNTLTDEQGFKVYGYIDLSGIVVLFNDYDNPNSENNITFTFPVYNENTYLNNYIDKCFIGAVYNSNNINSLFVCGNPNFPARDWHSEEINSSTLNDEESDILTTKDLVYFPDTSYCDYGEDSKNPILGYDVLGTGDLLVLKKYQKYEPTIYFRTGQLVAVKDNTTGDTLTDLIGATLYEPQYSLTTGNIGVSMTDYMKIVNYNGDTIFIGNDNKLNGLIKEDKAYDNQRYALTRSYLIDAYLHDLDLTNAILYQDSDCLYFINNKEMFVNKYNENATEDYMEYYHLTYDINIRNIFDIEDKLYIANDNGGLYLFRNKDTYYDEAYISLNSGELLANIDTNEITINSSKIGLIKVGNIIQLAEPIKVKIGSFNVDYTLDKETGFLTILPNSEYLSLFGGSFTISYQGNEYVATKYEGNIYRITDDLSTLEIDEETPIYLVINELKVSSVSYGNSKVKIEDYIFAEDLSTTGKLIQRKNISCYYITAPILFNDSYMGYNKNIHKITFANDTNEQNETNIDLLDNKIGLTDNSRIVSVKDNKGLNYNGLNLGIINYIQNKTLVKEQTIFKKLYKKPYVVLKFSNDNNTNSVLSKISFTYSKGTPLM